LKNAKIANVMKIVPFGRADGVMKLMVAFCNFANAPKK
jgi:hypothetical protein